MSPRQCDSPLVLTYKTSKVKRERYTHRAKTALLHTSGIESGWLGKKARPDVAKDDKTLKVIRKTYSRKEKDTLSNSRSQSGWLRIETVPESNVINQDILVKSGWLERSDEIFERIRDSSPPEKKTSTIENLDFATIPKSSHSPCIPELYSELQATSPMRERNTRSSTDRPGPGMSSGSASTMLTRPTGMRVNKCHDGDIVSPDNYESGWKRKRQEACDLNSPKSNNKHVKRSVTNLCDPDEIIEVDDTDTPPIKASRSLRSATALTDHSKLCEFPMGTKDSVSVCLADYKTLEHDTFLNDIIIDFYLTYLFHNFLNAEDRPTVHIFSTMFYKRLNSTPKKASTVASYEKDSTLKPAEKRHMRVKGWTKNVNLFEKNMVIIPICEHSHWYLIIAIRPGLITIPVGSEDRVRKGEPFMIVLDSMGGNKTAAVSIIRHYLAAEWKAKMCGEEGDEEEFEFSSKEMRTVRPSKPEQENYTDCGIYLLHYIEKMFNSVAQYYWPGQILDLSTWFTTQEVSTKRDEIARLIRELSEDQNPDKEMKFPNIPFLPTAPSTRSKSRKKEYEHQSSESEDDDWNVEKIYGSTGLAAAGFYGERSGTSRTLRKSSSSASGMTSGESDVSSFTSSERAREQRHRNRELRSKEKVQGSSTKEELGTDVSVKSVKTSSSSGISDTSRKKLEDKIKQIKNANTNFDERNRTTSKLVKDGGHINKVENLANKVRRPSSESVIVVDNMPASNQLANFRTSVIPTKKSSKKVEELEREGQSARNSIVNAMQIKSRADLHKELNCVADLQEIEAEMHEDEENLKRKGRKNKSAALKAFHADQKAIHESIVNEVTRIGCSDVVGNKQFSKSLPIPVSKKSKSSPEKRKVLQSKVLEDLLELEEEGNTEDEDAYGDVEVVNKVKVLKIADETEPEIRIRKVKITKAKESYKSIVTEKVKINRDGKELSKMAPEPQNVSPNENISECKQNVGSTMNYPFTSTVDDTPEITTVEDTPDSSIITTVEDETPDSSEVASIEDTAPDTVVAIEDDSPLVGFLERVEDPASSGRSSSSIEEPVIKKSKDQSDLPAARKSTSEPESPTTKVKITPDVDVVLVEKKSTSEPDPPQQIKTTPPVPTGGSSRGVFKGRLINRPSNESSARHVSEPVPPIAFRKSNGVQYNSKSKEGTPDTSVKSSQESLNSIIDLEAVATSEPLTMVNVVVKPVSGQTSPRSKGHKLKSTSEPRSPSPIEVISPSKPLSPGNSNIKITGTKSTSEPRSPEVSSVKTNSGPDSPIISSKRKSTPMFKMRKKNVKPPKIVVDTDSEDGWSSGPESNFQIPVERRRTSQRPRREMKFRNLSEIDRAKLKNIPTVMREAILAGAKQTHEVKTTKASDRNKLSRENPFYESVTASRGNRSTQQHQRGRSARNNSSLGSNRDSDKADQLITDSEKREVTKQIDLKENDKVATTSKRFRLNNHGKLSQNTSKPHNDETTANHLSQFADERFDSDSGSDTSDIYTTKEV